VRELRIDLGLQLGSPAGGHPVLAELPTLPPQAVEDGGGENGRDPTLPHQRSHAVGDGPGGSAWSGDGGRLLLDLADALSPVPTVA
jgi:hypothetical protein